MSSASCFAESTRSRSRRPRSMRSASACRRRRAPRARAFCSTGTTRITRHRAAGASTALSASAIRKQGRRCWSTSTGCTTRSSRRACARSRGSKRQRSAGDSARRLLQSTVASETRTGWCGRSVGHPDGLVDRSVPVLQSVRADGSAVATVVGYGAHTVATGVEYLGYSPDYVGPLRETVRRFGGGECVFLQGAAGNVMPLVGFDDELRSPGEMGRRIGLEALHAIADRPGWPVRLVQTGFGSATPLELFRFERVAADSPALAAVEAEVEFPLLPLPSPSAIAAERERGERALAEAEARGAPESELRVLRFHGLNWARRAEAGIGAGNRRTSVSG